MGVNPSKMVAGGHPLFACLVRKQNRFPGGAVQANGELITAIHGLGSVGNCGRYVRNPKEVRRIAQTCVEMLDLLRSRISAQKWPL